LTLDPHEAEMRKNRPRRAGASDYIEYCALRLLVAVLRLLPIEVGATVVGSLWRLVGLRSGRNRRVLENLQIAFPDIDQIEARRIAAAQWDNLGRTFAEALQLDRLIAGNRVDLTIDPKLDERLRQPGGHVMVSMHSANWELAALPIRRYRSVVGLYQKLGNPLSERFLLRIRAQVFDGGLLTKTVDASGLVMQWVRDGNAAAMLADHREGRGISVRAFGRETRATPFPAMVARRIDVPLIVGRAVRLPGSRFRVEAVEVEIPHTHDPQADVELATQKIQDLFDSWIRERPGEWMWVQNRWLDRVGPSRTEKRRARAARSAGACQPDKE
jgi:KDO2-lipid IV(A) lauroyltransferase